MRLSYNHDRSRAVAVWLFAVAAFVVAILVVGGATRLTGSGLSITEWKPVRGVLPPLSPADWAAEFHAYQHIPQYQLVNRGMTLAQFKPLFWWEWTHRLLGRLVGIVFFGPLVVFLALRKIPRRLIWRCVAIFALGGLQGLVGWWMVASGLTRRISVAPERLATHLGLALLLICACLWTGLEAWSGRARPSASRGRLWAWGPPALAALAYVQCILGALVSGNHAGLIDQDWPMMGGRVFPEGYMSAGQGLGTAFVHSAPAVQFDHRLTAYLLFAAVLAVAAAARKARHLASSIRALCFALAGAVLVQMLLGIGVLRMGDPLWMASLHQVGAVGVLSVALALAWRSRRA